mmetsp:Transcript_70815/g.122635  ORF Transcript_70815/g.122635 Transcript_70815/m.122635 type:complete len:81 (+) Transcript_70815:1852-2094(+)
MQMVCDGNSIGMAASVTKSTISTTTAMKATRERRGSRDEFQESYPVLLNNLSGSFWSQLAFNLSSIWATVPLCLVHVVDF